ncbi:glucokinase [Sphingomonas glacialis]|uniref:Glucokinase n=1 Tax=Sphingomonas glacialis TaxID=658225 RepID=A0A502FW86_9SPHN|nr:glucokinase [Sphingomonas glacialis]TPG53917.1 glucokinase [Sphingomonas glacialis]
MEVVSVDIGGTHARFAIAEVDKGRVVALGEPVTLKTAEYAGFQTAWEAFGQQIGRPLPRAAAIAVASPISGDVIKLTNNPWVIRPPLIKERLHVDEFVLINDFGAVGQAVAQVDHKDFLHLCGPDVPFADRGVLTVCGPGTGLGVAQVLRTADRYHVLETEGGHVDFAPLDAIEDRLTKRLRTNYTRVSAERVVSGPGIVAIYETLADLEHRTVPRLDDKAIWSAALDEGESLAVAALDRFCMSLGSVAGDLALAHGSNGVVIAGGLGLRLKDHIRKSGFAERFAAKGRFQGRMSAIPVKLITYPQPGLFGAAAAFAQEHTL